MATCEYGHENTEQARFCSTCGMAMSAYALPATGDMTTPAGGHSDATMTSEAVSTEGTAARSAQRLRDPKLLVAVAAAVLILAGVAVAASGLSGNKQTIEGTFTLFDDSVSGGLEDCEGTGGYSDVDAGVPVTVRDENDNIVGSGTLENASLEEIARRIAKQDKAPVDDVLTTLKAVDGLACTLIYDVEVEDAKFYDVQVGKRGKLSYSRVQLEEAEWQVSSGLGN